MGASQLSRAIAPITYGERGMMGSVYLLNAGSPKSMIAERLSAGHLIRYVSHALECNYYVIRYYAHVSHALECNYYAIRYYTHNYDRRNLAIQLPVRVLDTTAA